MFAGCICCGTATTTATATITTASTTSREAAKTKTTVPKTTAVTEWVEGIITSVRTRATLIPVSPLLVTVAPTSTATFANSAERTATLNASTTTTTVYASTTTTATETAHTSTAAAAPAKSVAATTNARVLANATSIVACSINTDFEVVAYTLSQLNENKATNDTSNTQLTVTLSYVTDSGILPDDISASTMRIIRESLWAILALDTFSKTSLIENRAEIVRCLPATREDAIDSLVELTRPFIEEGVMEDSACDALLAHMLGATSIASETTTVDPVPLACAWHLATQLGEDIPVCSCWHALARVTMRTGPICLWRLRSIVRTAAGDVGNCAWAIEIATL